MAGGDNSAKNAEKRLFKARTEIEAVRRQLTDAANRELLSDACSFCGNVISDIRAKRTTLKP